MNNNINRLNDSGAKAGLNLPTIRSFPIRMPSLPEQQKIADFLAAVDTRIEQLMQKKALLEEYKKGVMQQLFTQSIRFKDEQGEVFVEDWITMKFGEVFRISAGGDIDKDRFSQNQTPEHPYPVFANADKNDGLYGYASYLSLIHI